MRGAEPFCSTRPGWAGVSEKPASAARVNLQDQASPVSMITICGGLHLPRRE
jgi:hypothetical protein